MDKVEIHPEFTKDEDFFNFAIVSLVTSAMPAGRRWFTNPICIDFDDIDIKVGDELFATSEFRRDEYVPKKKRVADTECKKYKIVSYLI